MKNLSIAFSDDVAIASTKAAKRLGISRAEFIRQATIHELKLLKKQENQKEIIKCFNAMKRDPNYLQESKRILEGLEESLSLEEDEWWTKP